MTIIWGGLAIIPLIIVYGAPAGVILLLFWKVIGLIGFGMAPSLRGFFRTVWGWIKLIPLLLILALVSWIFTRVPVLKKPFEIAREIAGKIWNKGKEEMANQSAVYQVIGAALLAGLINSSFATNLTAPGGFLSFLTESKDGWYLIPGLIPGASALVGLGFFFWRTVLGNQLRMKATGKVVKRPLGKDGSTRYCINYGQQPVEDKAAAKRGIQKFKIDPETGKPKLRYVAQCGYPVEPGEHCSSPYCNHLDAYADWVCPRCSRKHSYDRLKCGCGTKKPDSPYCCVKCGYNGKDDNGIPWRIPFCPKCKAPRPKWPTSPFHYSWQDSYKGLPKEKQKKPPIAGGWQCRHREVVRTPAGKLVPKGFDETGNPFRGPDNRIIPKTEICNEWNSREATQCSKCGAPRTGTRQASPTAVPAPQTLVFKEPVLERPCLACGRLYDASRGYVSCPGCGASLSVRQGASAPSVTAPSPQPAPTAQPPQPASATPRPLGLRAWDDTF